jgi:hypothetical protein
MEKDSMKESLKESHEVFLNTTTATTTISSIGST